MRADLQVITTSISNPGYSLILEAFFLKLLLWASKEKKVRRENKNRLLLMVVNSMLLFFRSVTDATA